ncbi:MAG: 3-hydroxyacyl-CoA dehydrogenase NAD-binding domain-containing protein [Pseudomonadota bacterium]
MPDKEKIAILGAGVIGASWASLFLAAGHRVAVHDVSPEFEPAVRAYIKGAWPVLEALGYGGGDPEAVSFHTDPAEAVAGAAFIQESVPERIEVKHALYGAIEDALAPGAVIASSASGLTLTEMQGGWRDPAPLVLGHPFNPPHLIPLVEVMGNAKTRPGAVETAEQIYRAAGKETIRVEKEIAGHVANRLQAAIWREMLHLVEEGVCSVADADKAIWAGPGLRWAAMGPTLIWHLAAGPGGIEEYCNRYAPSFHRWWDDLGNPRVDGEMIARLRDGVAEEAQGRDLAALAGERDALIVAMLRATKGLRSEG